MGAIIKIENLTKKYNNFIAVNNISFNVEEGSFFAFLGPNGAGKSTTINVLCTLLKKNSGNIEICGYKLDEDNEMIRNNIGVVFQNSHLDDLLTVYENIKVRAGFYNIKKEIFNSRLEYISNTLGIKSILKKRYGKLSGGQKRRVDIARALINEPKILFLDEPTTGLDPQTRKKVWEILDLIQKKNNTTIFLTTHYMEEAVNADNIVIIDDGNIIANDSPMKLKEKYTSNILKLLPINYDYIINYLNLKSIKYESKSSAICIYLKNNMDSINIINDLKNYISSFEVLEGDMDQVFINLTGKDIRGEINENVN
ncbi:MAG: ABC transporter ATP-binding protein [Bacilli bacterium]|nr:ABC transporter ATP-binding protein [Bacilli bacterium]